MIQIISGSHNKINFPVGECHITQTQSPKRSSIFFQYQNDTEIIELMMLCNSLKEAGHTLKELIMPYVPYSRQDRISNKGEAFSLKVFAGIINRLGFGSVEITDAHSPVTTALINNCVEIPQEKVFKKVIANYGKHYLISPDGGALKKIYKSVNKSTIEVIECSKKRDTQTGKITGTVVHYNDFENSTCIIVDDICDGGRTFIEIAKVLKTKEAGKIILCVSHGFFTKGIEIFDNLIDEIYTKNGRVK
jgi:ribose-phosphate pyrophosphokinase